MGGLIKDFSLTALIIILNHWVYGIEDTISYEFVVNFIANKQTLFLTIGILGSGGLLLCSSLDSLGLYKITYGLSKVLVRASQFLITFLMVINVVFYVAIGNNLMLNNGYLMLFVLVLILGSACWSLRIIDFNYHTRNAMLPVGILAFLSAVLVQFIWPLYFF